jgi:hypothetical protein
VTDYYNERFSRDVKLDTAKEWERINEAKRAEVRASSTRTSPPIGAAGPSIPSPLRVVAPKLEVPAVQRARSGARSKTQQTLDTDSPLFAGAPRFAGAVRPTTPETAESPKIDGKGGEP